MRYLFLAIGLIALSIVHGPLLLVFTVAAAIYGRVREALFVGLMSGVLLDYLSGLPDGVFLLTFLLLVLILRFTMRLLSEKKDNLLTVAAIMLCATLGYYLLVFSLSQLFSFLGTGQSFNLVWFFRKNFWIAAVLNVILFYPTYRYYLFISKVSRRYETK